MINKILYYIVYSFHYIIIPIIILYIFFFVKNFVVNSIVLLLIFLSVYFWYVFEICFLVPIEHYLLNKKCEISNNYTCIKFFNYDVDTTQPKIKTFSWVGRNKLNGLKYGNGGLKLWRKDFVLDMKSHEASDNDRAQVDFCWEDGYQQFPECFSDTVITGSPFQAWRAGFREGVKMTLHDGVRVPPLEIKERVWWHNIHRLRMWSTVGAHEENGIYAVLGARMGTWMTNCTDWNYVDVRDFELLKTIYEEKVNHTFVEQDAQDYGTKINQQLGLDWPWLDARHSKYTLDLYEETVNLGLTYYRNIVNV
jgi:hypothetical protein